MVLAALGAAMAASPAQARVFPAEQARQADIALHSFTCPLGGERWSQPTGFPHLELVTFPDGSHLGDEWVDTQIPECPENGLLLLPDQAASEAQERSRDEDAPLLVYHTYTADELARLPTLLASTQWQALAGQTRSLKAYWLATWLDRPVRDRFSLLQWAGWGSETPEQRTTVLTTMVEQMPGLIERLDLGEDENATYRRGFLRYYVINALRELGRFDEALALMAEVEAAAPGVPMADDPDAIFGPSEFADPMRRAIAAGDTDRFAIDLLTDTMASRICGDSDSFAHYRGPHAKARCAAREEMLARQQEEFDAVYALLEDRTALAPRCAAGAGDDQVLAEACRRAQHEVDWAAGSALFDTDPAGAASQCEAVPEEQRNTVLIAACTSYSVYHDGALADLLVADLTAYRAICDAETEVGIGPFASPCTEASREVIAQQAVALWRDQPALRQRCRGGAWQEDVEFDGLDMACGALEDGTDTPYWFQDAGDEDGSAERTDPPYLSALPYAREHLAAELARRAGTTAD